MLLVKTKLAVSTIPNAGIGLFAAQDIPKGTKIWEYTKITDRIYGEEEFKKQEGLLGEFLKCYCFRYNNMYVFCGDNGRFFNHSPENQNCGSEGNTQFHMGYTVAFRDIKEGEELLDDYTKFGWSEEDAKFNADI